MPQPTNPLSGKEPLLYTAGDQTAKFIISRNPKLDTMTFDPKQWQSRIATVASIMDVSDVSLEQVQGQGRQDHPDPRHRGRLHHAAQHGALLQPAGEAVRQGRVDSFIRFYMIPGFGHGFGPFNAKIDSLTALRNWVEKGQAPSGLTAVDGNPNANRARPLCEWPKWPKFTGAPGSEGAAASFTCVAP